MMEDKLNSFNIYNNQYNMFKDIIKFNDKDPIYSNEYSIPISNKYYIMLLNNEDDTNKILNYLYNDDRDVDSPFDDILNMIGFDEEQIYNMTFANTDLKYIEKQINNSC